MDRYKYKNIRYMVTRGSIALTSSILGMRILCKTIKQSSQSYEVICSFYRSKGANHKEILKKESYTGY